MENAIRFLYAHHYGNTSHARGRSHVWFSNGQSKARGSVKRLISLYTTRYLKFVFIFQGSGPVLSENLTSICWKRPLCSHNQPHIQRVLFVLYFAPVEVYGPPTHDEPPKQQQCIEYSKISPPLALSIQSHSFLHPIASGLISAGDNKHKRWVGDHVMQHEGMLAYFLNHRSRC